MLQSVTFKTGTVDYYYQSDFQELRSVVDSRRTVVITDEHLHEHYSELFEGYKATIVLRSGEENKTTEAVSSIVQRLLDVQADRGTFILGVGGGMVTDIAGYVASTYMRGVKFGFASTSVLGMVDASIGGKNGVNYKKQKNLLGTFNQPQFILFDSSFLKTLPKEEWSNGFAEVIKYACLFDKKLFDSLMVYNLNHYMSLDDEMSVLIEKCADWKNKIVLEDEHEHGKRKLLNFGHTVGHAIEVDNKLPHGYAVGLGMLIACKLSEQFGLSEKVYNELKQVLHHFHLPTSAELDVDSLMSILMMDKKRNKEGVDFVMLNAIGSAEVQYISFDTIRKAIDDFIDAGNS